MTLLSFAVAVSVPLVAPFQEEQGQDLERRLTPVQVVVGPAQPQEQEGERWVEPKLSEASSGDVVHRDDGVPLPTPALVRPGPDGDTITVEAGGDPYFLGFSAGPHFPPADQLVDPLILKRYQSGLDGRPGDFTYAFVMFSRRMTEARLAQLEALGVRILKNHPHYTVKVAVPFQAIPEISTLPFVRWVGQPQDWQKVHPLLVRELEETTGSRINVTVNVHESDLNDASVGTLAGQASVVNPGSPGQVIQEPSGQEGGPRIWQSNGWQHDRLVQLGLDIQWYSPRSISFQGWIDRSRLQGLLDLDFVQGLENVPEAALGAAPHDESIPMISADRIRNTYDGDTDQVAIVGIMDSGVENDHTDLSLFGVGWDCTSASDPWSDAANGGSGHGTHCSGTVLGRGVTNSDLLGVAPGLATWGAESRYFNMRRFGGAGCTWSLDATLDVFRSSFTDGDGITTPKPHVITNSWGYTSGPYDGTEAHARSIDSAVYEDDQMWVWLAGNDGTSFIWGGGTAKNVLTVGSVTDYRVSGNDPGEISSFSSRGPVGDGRWKPNVVAPGQMVESCLANNNTGYIHFQGTSMATPHVAGVAATMVDHLSYTRYDPALTAAMLMATAITKDDQIITSPSSTHLDNYGAGRVSAYKAHWETAGYEYLQIATFDQTNANWFFNDFTVPVGTERLVAVMHYVEEDCSALASEALVNDYDFYLDRDPIDSAGDSGDYFAQQSSLDNTEIRIIDNPASGAWRWKTWPEAANSNVVKMGVVVYAILDETTTDVTLSLSVDDGWVQPGESVGVSATVDPTDYIASAVYLDRSGSFATMDSSSTTLYDGLVTDLTDSFSGGADITLGDTLDFAPRTATWGLSYASEGVKTVAVEARSDNMIDKLASISVTVDGTQPGVVSSLTSSSHVKDAWSNDPTITWTWNAASDSLSGIQGYGIYEPVSSCSIPAAILDIGDVTTYTSAAYGSSTLGRYFAIRSADMCDNWDDDYVCVGPYYIDVTAPSAPTFDTSDHAPGGKSCDADITVSWDAGADAHSGVAGYSYSWTSSATTCPDLTIDTVGTSASVTSMPPGTWYLHVRTIDSAGNGTDCASVAHFGPFTIVSSCVIFFDDFESGNFGGGGWSVSSPQRCKVNGNSAFSGSFGARLKKGGVGTGACTVGTQESWMEITVDSTGWSGIQVNMDAHFRRNELACEFLDLQWFDGVAWQSAGQVEAHAWANYSFSLPAGAMGDPALRVRLITNAKGKAERAEIDDFEMVGIE